MDGIEARAEAAGDVPGSRRVRGAVGARSRWMLRVGRVFGIEVNVHATLLVLLAWVAISRFVAARDVRVALAGLALSSSVFVIVLLHELGHALVARRFGVATRSIVLLPIGGVAMLERMPRRPVEELLVALAGPAVNVALAAGIAVVLVATGASFDPGAVEELRGPILAQLFWVNVSLATFNLVPAFPMDGGRALRALLAMVTTPSRATELAAGIGQVLAMVLGAIGLFANPLLILVALFVWSGARQESAHARLTAALRGVHVGEAMVGELAHLAPDDRLARAVAAELAGFQRDFPVVDDGRLVGVLTHDGLVRGLAASGAEGRVGDAMRAEVSRAERDELLDVVLERSMASQGLPIVVVDGDRPIGIVTEQNLGELVTLRRFLGGARAG